MSEVLRYTTWDLYDGENTQLDGTLIDESGETQLDIWSATEQDLRPGTPQRAQSTWEAGGVLAEEEGGVTSLIVPVEPLSLEAIEQALRRFRPEATEIDLEALTRDSD